jgi:hypothetical protein
MNLGKNILHKINTYFERSDEYSLYNGASDKWGALLAGMNDGKSFVLNDLYNIARNDIFSEIKSETEGTCTKLTLMNGSGNKIIESAIYDSEFSKTPFPSGMQVQVNASNTARLVDIRSLAQPADKIMKGMDTWSNGSQTFLRANAIYSSFGDKRNSFGHFYLADDAETTVKKLFERYGDKQIFHTLLRIHIQRATGVDIGWNGISGYLKDKNASVRELAPGNMLATTKELCIEALKQGDSARAIIHQADAMEGCRVAFPSDAQPAPAMFPNLIYKILENHKAENGQM